MVVIPGPRTDVLPSWLTKLLKKRPGGAVPPEIQSDAGTPAQRTVRGGTSELTPEQLFPITPPREPTEALKGAARAGYLHIIERTPDGGAIVTIGDNKQTIELSRSEFEIIQTPGISGFAGKDEPASEITGKAGGILKQRELAGISGRKLEAEETAFDVQTEQNKELTEARENARAQLELLGDVPPIVFDALPAIYSNTAILKSIAADIPGILSTAAVAGLAGVAAGKPRAAIALAGTTAASSLYGSWQSGTAKGAASSSGEARQEGMRAVTNIDGMIMSLRAGEPYAMYTDDGKPIFDVAVAFQQEIGHARHADAILTEIYGDEYFNLETGVGPAYEKIRGLIRESASYQREIAAAIVNPPAPGTPEYAAAQTAYADWKSKQGTESGE